jgi:cell division protein FtsL
MIRRVPAKHRNAPVNRERDTEALIRLVLLLVVGLGLTCGFVYAGRQHFAALKYGYETENLRREHDQLSEQQRRLILQREEAASPGKLEQAAKRLGMQALQAAQVDPLRQPHNAKDNDPIQAKENPTKLRAKPNTKTITKVPEPVLAKPSRKKRI